MSKKLRERMQYELLEIAKSSNVSPSEFISALGTAFLNICGWICDKSGYTEEDRNDFFNELLRALEESIETTKNRRANNGTI